MRRIFAFLVVCLVSVSARAAAPECVCVPKEPEKAIELMVGSASGGPAGLLFLKEPMPGEVPRYSGIVRVRSRIPAKSASAIELNFVPWHGFGANLVSDIIRVGDFRLHLVMLGAMWNVWAPMSATSVHRSIDVTFGTGMEYRLKKHNLVLTLDWRAYMSNPLAKMKMDDPQANAKVGEALKGAQVWLGCSWILPF